MDIRTYLFDPLNGSSFVAELTAAESGILAGMDLLCSRASELDIHLQPLAQDGAKLISGSAILRLTGTAEDIARAEEELLACVGKPSGVATASAHFVEQAAGQARIVCGAWKKVAPELRKQLRQAIAVGGAGMRLIDEPFVYLDKNYVRMFGGISMAVQRGLGVDGRTVCVQLRGDTTHVAEEALEAFRAGAGVLMVDTGKIDDLQSVVSTARSEGFRSSLRIAFSGGVNSASLEEIIAIGADIVDVGRPIIDAPLLDFRFDVIRKV
jgi:nicotinate-nucleotide pyrophosphorylase (carboxylating)